MMYAMTVQAKKRSRTKVIMDSSEEDSDANAIEEASDDQDDSDNEMDRLENTKKDKDDDHSDDADDEKKNQPAKAKNPEKQGGLTPSAEAQRSHSRSWFCCPSCSASPTARIPGMDPLQLASSIWCPGSTWCPWGRIRDRRSFLFQERRAVCGAARMSRSTCMA